jgi:hypothetical protein
MARLTFALVCIAACTADLQSGVCGGRSEAELQPDRNDLGFNRHGVSSLTFEFVRFLLLCSEHLSWHDAN